MRTSKPCSGSSPNRRPRASKTRWLCAVLAVVVNIPAAADRVELLAQALADTAASALSLGYDTEARELLDEALALDPGCSDAAYLRATLALSLGEPRAQAMELLASGLTASRFSRQRRTDAEVLYASLLARSRQPDGALSFLRDKPRTADVIYAELLARLAKGQGDQARQLVAEALRRSPDDLRPLTVWLESGMPRLDIPADSAILDLAFKLLPAFKDAEPNLLLALAPFAPDDDEARLLIREFRALRNESHRSSILACRYGLIDATKMIAELFSAQRPVARSDLEDAYRLLPDDDARAEFTAAFSAFTGDLPQDSDRDGLAEENARYRNGQLVAWMLDANQDGIPDRHATFKDGAPASLGLITPSTSVVITFGTWPYAGNVSVDDQRGVRVYSFGPAAFSYRALELERFPGLKDGPWLVSDAGLGLPTETALAAQAWKAESLNDGVSLTAFLVDGIPSSAWWTNDFGSSGYTDYVRGIPADERLDIDGDGIFDGRRVWTRAADGSARPAYVELDLDGDGVLEYRESLLEPIIKSWDADADGSPDLYHERLDSTRERYRFTPSWRKRAPLEVILERGRPVRVMLGGVERSLVPDSGGTVMWMGTKPFDLGPDAVSGTYVRNGVRYSVIELGGMLYAEKLE